MPRGEQHCSQYLRKSEQAAEVQLGGAVIFLQLLLTLCTGILCEGGWYSMGDDLATCSCFSLNLGFLKNILV